MASQPRADPNAWPNPVILAMATPLAIIGGVLCATARPTNPLIESFLWGATLGAGWLAVLHGLPLALAPLALAWRRRRATAEPGRDPPPPGAPVPIGTARDGLQAEITGTGPDARHDGAGFRITTWPTTTIEADFRLSLRRHPNDGRPIRVVGARLELRADEGGGRRLIGIAALVTADGRPIEAILDRGVDRIDLDVATAEGSGRPSRARAELTLALAVEGRAEPLAWLLARGDWAGG